MRWISILRAGCVVDLPRPYHRNFSKRIVRTPEL